MIADLYDFDKTVYKYDSGIMFYLFCLTRNLKIIKFLPKQIAAFVKYYLLKKITIEQMKEQFYSFITIIDAEKYAEEFWDKYSYNIYPWFEPKENDIPVIICSASPLFQIKPICDKLGVKLIIATQIDLKTGKIIGKNCKGEEKINRISKEAAEYIFRNAYTDNIISDKPLLNLATEKKYHVYNGEAHLISEDV